MSSVSALNSLLSSATSSTGSGIDLSSILTAATGATSTGIDVTSAVDAAIYAARAPERQWQSQQTNAQNQITTLSSIQTALASVTSDLSALADPLGAVTARTVSSSNASAVTATASASASLATHTITVDQLASPTGWYSSPLLSATSPTGSSMLRLTDSSGAVHSYTLGSGGSNSLSALASAINSDSFGVKASVVTDLSGARLALTSSSTGSASNFSVTDTVSSAPTFTSATLASTASLSAGTFTLGDGVSSQSIAVSSGDSLNDLAGKINASGLALTASVISDTGGGSHLSISANSGDSGTVAVSADPAVSLTQSSTGTDAQLHVDGVPVTSATNTVKGAITGVTLNLQSVTTGSAAQIQVAADANSVSAALSQFVQDYNAAVKLVNSQFSVSTTSTTAGQLGSSSDIRSLQGALLGIAAYTSNGTSGASGTLATLGITMADDGSLSLDQPTLTKALASNVDLVQNILQGSASNGFAATAKTALNTYSNSSTGVLAIASNHLQTQVSKLQSQISDFESGYIASQQTLLTSMYSKAEIALQQLPATLKQIQAQLGNNSGS